MFTASRSRAIRVIEAFAWSTPLGPPISMGERLRRMVYPPRSPHINGGKVSPHGLPPRSPHINGGKVSPLGLPPLGPPISMEGRFRRLVYPLGPPISMEGRFRRLVYPPRSPHINGGKVSPLGLPPSVPPYQWRESFAEICSMSQTGDSRSRLCIFVERLRFYFERSKL